MVDQEPDGATPVDEDEAADLIPKHIRTRSELNAWEQANIIEAVRWSEQTRLDALDESFARELHRRMFESTWKWAGQYRTSNKNIGVDWTQIPADVKSLVDDGIYWIEHGTFSIDEASLRLHHRMVAIHPFPNGNGRHGRLWCDIVLQQHGRPPFVWKNEDLDNPGTARTRYIEALRAADGNDYGPLIELILADG